MNLSVSSRLGLLIFSLGLLAGCAALPGSAPGPEPAVDLRPVFAKLDRQKQAWAGLELSGEMELSQEGSGQSGELKMSIAGPDRLRAEIYGPFNQLALRLLVDGDQMAVIMPQENRAYVGRASRANLARLMGLDFSPQEMIAFMCGTVLLPADRSRAEGFVSGSNMVVRLAEAGELSLVVNRRNYDILEAYGQDGQGREMWQVRFAGQKELAPQHNFPHRILMQDSLGRGLNIWYDEVLINSVFTPNLFSISMPAGMEVVILD